MDLSNSAFVAPLAIIGILDMTKASNHSVSDSYSFMNNNATHYLISLSRHFLNKLSICMSQILVGVVNEIEFIRLMEIQTVNRNSF